MTTGMIVLAGGIGKRIGRPFPKQFLLLGGKPLIIHVLEKARAIPEIERVVITCPEAHLDADPRADREPPAAARSSSASTAAHRARSRSTTGCSALEGVRLDPHPRGGPAARHGRGVP